jgi:hypothetical protein
MTPEVLTFCSTYKPFSAKQKPMLKTNKITMTNIRITDLSFEII